MNRFFKSYALIGSGRLAGHLQHYLKILGVPLTCWSRNGDPQFNSIAYPDRYARLAQTIGVASHVLFAVKDDALLELTRPWRDSGKVLVHFSGALNLQGVFAAHPLMTFGPKLEDEAWYRKIPFVVDEGVKFKRILPRLPNPSWELEPAKRPLYHAMCSLAANASYLLWQQIGKEFEETLDLPRNLISPLLHQVVENSADHGSNAFTGPVARGDWQIVLEHLRALNMNHSELLVAYRDYLSLAQRSGLHIPEEML